MSALEGLTDIPRDTQTAHCPKQDTCASSDGLELLTFTDFGAPIIQMSDP